MTFEAPKTSYDDIAEIYDADMGANLPFDDVAFYYSQCKGAEHVLELGCGTGRVLLPLATKGIQITGIDCSEGMLAVLHRKAAKNGVAANTFVVDATNLPFRSQFDRIIAPFSMVVYMTSDLALRRFFTSAASALRPGGRLIVDAFLPRGIDGWRDFRQDYKRPTSAGSLQRERRVRPIGTGVNEVERRYTLTRNDGSATTWSTVERIRPYHHADLAKAAAAAGLADVEAFYDYGLADGPQNAQFGTYVFEHPTI